MTDDRHPSVSCDAWLDAHEVDDSLIARAYESVGGQGRAILKKNIARIHRLWGELPPREQLSRRFSRDFCLDLDDQPVSCALICCPAAFSHPAPLLAAVMPAVLAGVQSILPCFLSHTDTGSNNDAFERDFPKPSLLAALELAGLERVFLAGADELRSLLGMLHAEHPEIRQVLLGEPGLSAGLALEAHERGVPSLSLTGSLFYYSQRLCSVTELSPESFSGTGPRETVPADDRDLSDRHVFLNVDDAHEDIWIWPDLKPSWFRHGHMRLFSSCAQK